MLKCAVALLSNLSFVIHLPAIVNNKDAELHGGTSLFDLEQSDQEAQTSASSSPKRRKETETVVWKLTAKSREYMDLMNHFKCKCC